MDCKLSFHCVTLHTGRICHYFYDSTNGFKYRRKGVKKSGQAYFVCCINKCKAKMIAKYENKEASLGDGVPVIIRFPQDRDHCHEGSQVDALVHDAKKVMKLKIMENNEAILEDVYNEEVNRVLKSIDNPQMKEGFKKKMPKYRSLSRTLKRIQDAARRNLGNVEGVGDNVFVWEDDQDGSASFLEGMHMGSDESAMDSIKLETNYFDDDPQETETPKPINQPDPSDPGYLETQLPVGYSDLPETSLPLNHPGLPQTLSYMNELITEAKLTMFKALEVSRTIDNSELEAPKSTQEILLSLQSSLSDAVKILDESRLSIEKLNHPCHFIKTELSDEDSEFKDNMFDGDIENSLKREHLDDSFDGVMNDENCEARTITEDGPFLTDVYHVQGDSTNKDGEIESESDEVPTFFEVKKLTGRITYNAMHAGFIFYRKSVKESGYGMFSCSNKYCKARLLVKYENKEQSNTDAVPLILKLPSRANHIFEDGTLHIPDKAAVLVCRTKKIIKERIESDPHELVNKVYKASVQEVVDSLTDDDTLKHDFLTQMPTINQMQRTMYRWRNALLPR
eukprot:TRINITY_DN5784_c0_g1_i4.p1 TRINITY_DN5784_c0_g1~~TRINITY_DN5784_c0_g1_i4.p1  ORF type:complete len:566 (-),score=92.42 TRINITY_DN5784_c0_g1_i4:448-2145(-)